MIEFFKTWDIIAKEENEKNPFFKRVYKSQKAYAAKVIPARRFMFPPYSFGANYSSRRRRSNGAGVRPSGSDAVVPAVVLWCQTHGV